MIKDIVLLHGWGLNSAVWTDFQSLAKQKAPELEFHALDLPGYGECQQVPFNGGLIDMADSVLKRAPESAIWVGWSLGGMVTLKAALLERHRIKGMYLIASSACFVEKEDWPYGVKQDVFQRFADELASDYRSALSVFLLLQAGANKGSREVARSVHEKICQFPDPSVDTLLNGIECLKHTDLRSELSTCGFIKSIPSHVLSCELDRVASPRAVRELAVQLQSGLINFRTGHAPFFTQPEDVLSDLRAFIERVNDAK